MLDSMLHCNMVRFYHCLLCTVIILAAPDSHMEHIYVFSVRDREECVCLCHHPTATTRVTPMSQSAVPQVHHKY